MPVKREPSQIKVKRLVKKNKFITVEGRHKVPFSELYQVWELIIRPVFSTVISYDSVLAKLCECLKYALTHLYVGGGA